MSLLLRKPGRIVECVYVGLSPNLAMLHRWYEDMEDRHPDPLMQCDAAKDSIFAYHTNKRSKDGETPKRTWQFRVAGHGIDKGETICLSGGCPELGSWKIKDSVIMTRLGQEEDSEWTCTVHIPMEQVEYRYGVCIVIEPDGVRHQSRRIIVRRWETNVIPRIIKDTGPQQSVRVDEFGHFDHYQRVDRGWLTTETVIQLKLFNNPIQMWKSKLQNVKLFIKVTPVNLSRNSMSTESMYIGEHNLDESLGLDTQDGASHAHNWPISEVAVMSDGENEFRAQSQFGRAYNKDDVIIFNISLHNPEMVAYLMDFYAYSTRMADGDPPYHVGFSYVLPVTMKQSLGQTVVPITSTRQQPIGQITVEYVVINPIPDFECDMSTTYTRHWKQNWLGLDVGHRGLGNSFNKFKTKGCAEVRENTIASLKTAASHGADFVEFDVQLSKDLVPVIYHDFYVCISMKKKKNEADEVEMLQLPVKELTLGQLHLLKVYHLQEGKEKCQQIFDEDLEEHQPFPTLQQVLEVIDPHVGFNIEIKWTMQLKDGTYELNHPFDLNMYLDTVLKVVLQHGGTRKIVFSCFHPDICTMIRLKQNKYPVMFLTQGVTEKYPMYNDPICQTIPMAVHYAISANILGINVHTEDILRDSSQVKLAKDAGLVIFCWGEDNNDAGTIRHLKDLGMHAVIYDKMDQYNSKEVKESIFLAESRAQKEIRKIMSDVAVDMSESSSHVQSNGKYTLETAMSSMTTSSTLWSQNSPKGVEGDTSADAGQNGSKDCPHSSVKSADRIAPSQVSASQ